MNKEQKIEWLRRYEFAYYKVKDIKYQLINENNISALVWSDSKVENRHYTLDDLLVRCEELNDEYRTAKEECSVIRKEILEALKSIKDAGVYRVMYLRYLVLLEWGTIADWMHYSEANIYKLHKKGLECIELPL